jgi:hypothetical protein
MGRKREAARIYEDPNIERVARIEAVRVWQEIEDVLSREIVPFHHQREIALAKNIPGIAKTYGKEVARRVERAIMSRAPHTLDKACRGPVEALLMENAIKNHGRLRLRDRLSFWLSGLPWSLRKIPIGRPKHKQLQNTINDPKSVTTPKVRANEKQRCAPVDSQGRRLTIGEYVNLSNQLEADRERQTPRGRGFRA